MFNRVVTRCLSVAKKPLPHNRISGHSSQSISSRFLIPRDTLLLNKCICTSMSRRSKEEEERRQAAVKTAYAQQLETLLASDPDAAKRYKILELELDVMAQGGYSNLPQNLKPQHWLELLKSESRSARKKYLQFLFLTEKKRENVERKKEQLRMERDRLRESGELELSEYGLHRISMFMRIYDTTIHHFNHSRLIQAMMFGEKLVIDCGYYAHMTPRECNECAKQLALLFAENRLHRQPFDLHFCNVNKSSILMEKFIKRIPIAYNDDFPLNIHECSYTDLFDKNKLVYLTPHTNNEMKDYDYDSIYIIGGIVDKTNSEPLTLARAKKEGLRMAKLPLDKYLLWGPGSGKRLPLNQMVNILADISITGDWQTSLRHVPTRKLEQPIDGMRTPSSDHRRSQPFDRTRSQPFDRTRSQPFDRTRSQPFDRTRLQPFDQMRSESQFGYKQRSRLTRETDGKNEPSFGHTSIQRDFLNK